MIEKLRKNDEFWDLFTRREEYRTEYNAPLLDQYDRYPYYLSNYRNIFEPKISKYLIENGFCIEYPGNKKFGVCLTHDIDFVYYPKLFTAKDIFRSLKLRGFKSSSKSVSFLVKNHYWNFRNIMALEEKYNAKSSFYFLALENGDLGFTFDVEDLGYEMVNIIDNGWEVGLHGGHEAYKNYTQMKKQKARLESILGKDVLGYRNHYLRFKVPDTWELLAKSGFKYDTTFGYADCAGFRNGMCHPFKPFNLNTGGEIGILEIPLTIMDCTLFEYMRLDIKGAWNLFRMLIKNVEKYNGILTILWHNTNMSGENLKFYEAILKYCHENNAWMTCGEDIFEWYERNVI